MNREPTGPLETKENLERLMEQCDSLFRKAVITGKEIRIIKVEMDVSKKKRRMTKKRKREWSLS